MGHKSYLWSDWDHCFICDIDFNDESVSFKKTGLRPKDRFNTFLTFPDGTSCLISYYVCCHCHKKIRNENKTISKLLTKKLDERFGEIFLKKQVNNEQET